MNNVGSNISPAEPSAAGAGAGAAASRKPLSAFGAWALGFGCAVGWGSFVMPGTSFLPNAGPLGTGIAMTIGAAIMVLIAVSYRFMMQRYPVAGGAFIYTHNTFGRSHGFACGWFLLLAFLPLVAQNATALTLLSRNLLNNIAEFGLGYSLAGYQVYLGEIFVDVAIMALFAFILVRSTRLGYVAQSIFAICMIAFLALMITGVSTNPSVTAESLYPLFSPTKPPVLGILVVVSMAPWAFVGFDAVSQTADEFSFPVRTIGRVMVLAIAAALVVYVTGTVVAAAMTPPEFSTWADQLVELDKLEGLESIPLFYAVSALYGDAATALLSVAVLGAILSGVVGFAIASSRVLVVMAQEGNLPARLARRDPVRNTPRNAIIVTFVAAALMSFLGRAILSWLMDIASIGAAVSFLYTAAATWKVARAEGRRGIAAAGALGVAFSAIFIALLVVPIPQLGAQLQVQSLVFLAAWVALGMNFYVPRYETRKHLDIDKHLTQIDSESPVR